MDDFTLSINSLEKNLDSLNKIIYQQIESDRSMAQIGSIQQKSEVASKQLQDLTEINNSFNQTSAQILARKESGEFKNYTPEYVQELVKEESQKHLAAYIPKVENTLKDSLDWLLLSVNQKEEIRFPLRKDNNPGKAQLGELKSLRANNFISSARTKPDLVLNELYSAYRSADTDYFNSLVDLILSEENESTKSDPNFKNLFSQTKSLYKDFANQNNFSILDIAIVTFKTVAKEANSFLTALKDGSLYFVPERVVKGMNQNEVAQNVEMVNSSMPYWKTELESLKYYHQLV